MCLYECLVTAKSFLSFLKCSISPCCKFVCFFSSCRLFGEGNLGDYALDKFKRNHKCNEYCAALGLGGMIC